MLDALKQVLDVLVFAMTFIASTLTALVQLVISIPSYIVFLTSAVATLPTWIVSFIMLGIMATTLLFILGRHS